jgi:hypothetical protein
LPGIPTEPAFATPIPVELPSVRSSQTYPAQMTCPGFHPCSSKHNGFENGSFRRMELFSRAIIYGW